MFNQIVAIPIELRMVILFLVGMCAGAIANWAIHDWSIRRLRVSPWSKPDPEAPQRHWTDRIPITGWWGLRREHKLFGHGHWMRGAAIEIGLGLSFAAYYVWSINGGQYSDKLGALPGTLAKGTLLELHLRYAVHLLLLWLMTVATFIDFDEHVIPDQVTLFGAVIAIGLITWLPSTRMPELVMPRDKPVFVDHLTLTSPLPWPAGLHELKGLWYGLACYVGWCIAVWPKLWTSKQGIFKGLQFMWASVVRPPRKNKKEGVPQRRPDATLYIMLAFTILGVAGVIGGYYWGGEHWEAMLTCLVGLAFGGGMIWAVRLIAGAALQQEAMGFGDVTLMAMIGVFVGWQASLLIFFLAPFTSLVIALAQRVISGENHIAFGPYLCAGTVITLLWWSTIWTGWANGIFAMGWLVPQMVGIGLFLMGAMLLGLRYLKS